jgi:mRNA interferase MazF
VKRSLPHTPSSKSFFSKKGLDKIFKECVRRLGGGARSGLVAILSFSTYTEKGNCFTAKNSYGKLLENLFKTAGFAPKIGIDEKQTQKGKEGPQMSIRRGDIYYADLSPVVGSEQGGLRPVLIIQNDIGNRYSPTVIAAAITSRMSKTRLPTHIDIYAEEAGLAKDSVILLEQIRTLDKKRLKEKMGHLGEGMMDHVNTAIAISFGLGNPQEDADRRAMMQRAPAYTPRTPAAAATTATMPQASPLAPSAAPVQYTASAANTSEGSAGLPIPEKPNQTT